MLGWLSTFLMNPALAAGTAAVAGPILIHILSKRRFRRVQWAAMDFLLEAHRHNRRRVRMEQLILLVLRCLAMLLLALMIARPFLRAGTVGSLLGSVGRTERIVLLDDSFSMGYRLSDGQSVFQRATAAVKQIAQSAAAESPADTFTLILTSRPRQPLCALPSLSEENARKLDDAIEGVVPSQLAARFPDATQSVAQLIRSTASQANTAIYVISDFQRTDWARTANEPTSPALTPLADLITQSKSCRLTLVDVSIDSPKNLALTDLVALQPQIAAGVPARFELAVANHSPAAVEQLELTAAIADQTLPPIIIPRIAPGQTVREPIEITFPTDGANQLRIQLSGAAASSDALALDNARSIGAQVVPAIHALIINGEPGADPLRDETYLLRTALRPAGRAASGFDLTITTEQELDGLDWSRFQVAILANVARLGVGPRQSTESFARNGGGLIIFAGDQVDADYYNRELFAEGQGILPVTLGASASPAAGQEPFHLADWDANHPILRAFSGPLATVLRQVRILEFTSVRLPAITTTQSTSAPAGPQILARYDDPDHSPAIVLSSFGRGAVLFITTSADQEWNDWASNFSYVPLMLEAAAFASRSPDAPSRITAGSPLVFPFDPAEYKPTARLRTPTYPVDPEISLVRESLLVPSSPTTPSLQYDDTTRCGLWSVELTTTSGDPRRSFVAVNPDPRESDLAPVGRAGLETAMGDLTYDYVRDVAAFNADALAARQEFWWPLLLAAVVVLMTEQALAWHFGRRVVT
ncbi:MAG: BatA domain-containing protein [Planctomycetota bacterium]